jgi:hypothetical protein
MRPAAVIGRDRQASLEQQAEAARLAPSEWFASGQAAPEVHAAFSQRRYAINQSAISQNQPRVEAEFTKRRVRRKPAASIQWQRPNPFGIDSQIPATMSTVVEIPIR